MTVVVRSGATDTNSINVLYRNVFDEFGVIVSSQQAEYPGSNIADDPTRTGWKPVTVPAYAFTDCRTTIKIDCLGIAAHNLGTLGASIGIQYSVDNITWIGASADYSPITDDDILFCFPETRARYWRIKIDDATPFIGVVKLGKKLVFPNAPLEGHKPLHHSRKVELLSNKSMGGHLLGNRPIKMGADTSINVGMVDRDWAENDLAAFEDHYNNGGAFFYCGSPSDTPKDMGYCWRPESGGEMAITWVEGDIMADVSFEVSAYVAT